jgi:iron complex outermembrane recepter protein
LAFNVNRLRQSNNIIADLNYQLPTQNPFDRIIDHDTPSRADNQLGGVSLNADVKIGSGTLTSTPAWRYWLWGPLNVLNRRKVQRTAALVV